MSSSSPPRSESSSRCSPPSCSTCHGQEVESKTYCHTCNAYLCATCYETHKSISMYTNHCVVLLTDLGNLEDFEKIAEVKKPDDASSQAKLMLEEKFWEGTSYVNQLLQTSYDLRTTLENLGRQRTEILGYISELHRRFQEHLRVQKDQIVRIIDEEYNAKQRSIATERATYDRHIDDLVITLSEMKMYLDGCGDEACGLNMEMLFRDEPELKKPCFNVEDWYENDEVTATFIKNSCLETPSSFSIDSPLRSLPSTSSLNLNAVTSVTNSHVGPVSTIQIYKTFGQKGNGAGQFNSPHGFCIGLDEDVVVADSTNHRVQVFDKNGRFKLQFGVAGRHDGYLWHPRKVAILLSQRRYVVCDRGYERSRMQIFTETGKFVKKIYIQYVDIVAGVTVNDKEDIVIVNSVTPTVFIIGQNDFLRSIDCTSFMQEPSDISCVGNEIFICDFKAHSIVVIDDEGNLLRKFGNKNTTVFPNGISITPSGYVFIGDSHGNFFHIVVYSKEGVYIGEYRCPYIKVSRCCGLKITKGGRLITVDKNYHHVIVLDTPAILGS